MAQQSGNNILNRFLGAMNLGEKERWILVLEGGAMRNIFTAGVLDALHEVIYNRFHTVIAVSGGAACGISMMANQKGRMQNLFLNHFANRQFVDFRKVWDGNDILNIRDIFTEIHKEISPIDLNTFEKSKTELQVTLTCAETGKTEFHSPNREDLLETLITGCNFPYLTKKPAKFKGKSYVDGGVSDPLPISHGVSQGATKIVLVSTRPHGFRKSKSALMNRILGKLFAEFAPLKELLHHDHEVYNTARMYAENFQHTNCDLFVIEPPKDFPVERLTTDRDKLYHAYSMGLIEGMKWENVFKKAFV